MSNYNPYTASFRAIATELTSDRAKQFYAIRAQQDTQMVIDATLTAGIAVYEAAVLAYQMGAFVRAWMHAVEQSAIECMAIVPVAPAAVAIIEIPDDFIEGEIVEESVVYQLAPAAPVSVAHAALRNEQFVLNAIRPAALKPWEAIAPLTNALIAETKTTKTKTTAKKRTPKANAKTATPAPRKSPTRATVGTLTLSID